MKAGRNDPCPCGSGHKYKHCCQSKISGRGEQATIAQLMHAAIAHHQAGQLDQAETRYRQVLRLEPANPDANHYLGIIAMQVGQLAAGLHHLEAAWKVAPLNPQFCLALTECLLNLERANDALRVIQSAVPHRFNTHQAQHLLQLAQGITSGGRPTLSVEREVIALFNAAQYALLEERMTPLMAQYPNWGPGWQLLGIALASQNKPAETEFRRAVELSPNDADANNNLGKALQDGGQLENAALSYRRALELKPDFAEAHNNLGNALRNLERPEAAILSCRRALELKPDFAEAYNNLGNALQDTNQLESAAACFRRALELKPNLAEVHNNLGNSLRHLNHLDAAHASYRRALELDPQFSKANSNLLLTMQYAEGHTPAELFAEHQAYAQRFESPLKANWLPCPNARNSSKRLKIGYVSPDFRNHAVAFFIEPVLASHNRQQFEIFCYYNHAVSDEVTQRLTLLADHWRDIHAISDDAATAQIRADCIDILVDLAGHTAGGRMLTFARKPAPLQVTWLGYFCTTGLSAMDYRITDAHADPIGMSECYYSETLYRLPDTFVCYQPPKDTPQVGALPAIARGCITFGSFNNLTKLTSDVLKLWAQVLSAVPGSRLLLKAAALADAATRQQLIADFAAHGVNEDRLMLVSSDATHFEHLNRYNQVDIGLDPFPCNGGTTSFDAMWMGVPVVTLAGDRFISRMGVSILTSVGLTELIADTPDDYVAIAVSLAGDLDRMVTLRAGLRERMTTSPLIDAKRFTLNLEQAYREMWTIWCGRLRA